MPGPERAFGGAGVFLGGLHGAGEHRGARRSTERQSRGWCAGAGGVRSEENLGAPGGGSEEGEELVPAAVPAPPVLATALRRSAVPGASAPLAGFVAPH